MSKPSVMLSKMSIRVKVTAVVTILLLAMTGMGLLAVKSMQAMNRNTVEISVNWLPSIRKLGELRAGVISYRSLAREPVPKTESEELPVRDSGPRTDQHSWT